MLLFKDVCATTIRCIGILFHLFRIGLSLYSYIFVIDGGPKGVGSSRIWGCTFRAYILLRCVKPIGTHGYILREIICTSMVIYVMVIG